MTRAGVPSCPGSSRVGGYTVFVGLIAGWISVQGVYSGCMGCMRL